jgi:hypothetical protein
VKTSFVFRLTWTPLNHLPPDHFWLFGGPQLPFALFAWDTKPPKPAPLILKEVLRLNSFSLNLYGLLWG